MRTVNWQYVPWPEASISHRRRASTAQRLVGECSSPRVEGPSHHSYCHRHSHSLTIQIRQYVTGLGEVGGVKCADFPLAHPSTRLSIPLSACTWIRSLSENLLQVGSRYHVTALCDLIGEEVLWRSIEVCSIFLYVHLLCPSPLLRNHRPIHQAWRRQ